MFLGKWSAKQVAALANSFFFFQPENNFILLSRAGAETGARLTGVINYLPASRPASKPIELRASEREQSLDGLVSKRRELVAVVGFVRVRRASSPLRHVERAGGGRERRGEEELTHSTDWPRPVRSECTLSGSAPFFSSVASRRPLVRLTGVQIPMIIDRSSASRRPAGRPPSRAPTPRSPSAGCERAN